MEDLCAWVVVLLLLSSFLSSLLSFREVTEAGEAVRKTERVLYCLYWEPGLLENLPGVKGVGIWRGENLLAGREKPPNLQTVALPAALRTGFSAVLVEVEAWG